MVSDLLEAKVEVIVATQTAAIEAARKRHLHRAHRLRRGVRPGGQRLREEPGAPGVQHDRRVEQCCPTSRPGSSSSSRSRCRTRAASRWCSITVTAPPPRRAAITRRPREKLMLDLRVIQAGNAEQLLAAVGAARSLRVQALVGASRRRSSSRSRAALVKALAAQKLPALFTQVQNVEAGGLMSYGPDIAASYRRGAYYVDRLLKGAQAAELPIEAPSKIELRGQSEGRRRAPPGAAAGPPQAGQPANQVPGTSFARSSQAKERPMAYIVAGLTKGAHQARGLIRALADAGFPREEIDMSGRADRRPGRRWESPRTKPTCSPRARAAAAPSSWSRPTTSSRPSRPPCSCISTARWTSSPATPAGAGWAGAGAFAHPASMVSIGHYALVFGDYPGGSGRIYPDLRAARGATGQGRTTRL